MNIFKKNKDTPRYALGYSDIFLLFIFLCFSWAFLLPSSEKKDQSNQQRSK